MAVNLRSGTATHNPRLRALGPRDDRGSDAGQTFRLQLKLQMAAEYLNISYAPDEPTNKLLQFDIYWPGSAHADPSRRVDALVCFVHGGAWRAEDKADHADLARNLAAHIGLCVAVPNYRLTSTNPTSQNYHLAHPAHAEDLLRFLTFIRAWQGPEEMKDQFVPRQMYLIGHSCSAHMLASIFLDSSTTTPSLTPPPQVYDAVQAVIMSEGIYDIDLLLSVFPTYRQWFIEDTFGQRPTFEDVDVTGYPLRSDTHIHWLVLHSTGDTLVDVQQTEKMYRHLCSLHGVAGIDPLLRVGMDADRLNGDHNDILRGSEYVAIIGEYVKKVRS
ncbi:hypothetical protein PLICRDRAFT_30071 [Plicaturopsis crispa FD-325 SS-3]|nr:hypothetical protein PLICRDRAFT_30071 [Plicaturopsis crispa FD-325 SS-3]